MKNTRLIFIENDGALFRGPSRSLPLEVWDSRIKGFKPYKTRLPKSIEWGYEISEQEAWEMMVATPIQPSVVH